jgi:tRNA(Ile)-lysidine synthase TilS/MesJ
MREFDNIERILSHTRKAVEEYNMIENGDKIAVGISGGKDSLTLLCALAKLKRVLGLDYDIVAITIDMGFEGSDFSPIQRLCDELEIEYRVVKTEIFEIIFNVRKEKSPCSLCAKLRRGALNEAAKRLGANKVALGHHFDDAVETFMLNLFYEGRIGCFSPVTYLDRKDITLIRPLLYAPENYISGFARRFELPIVQNRCPEDKRTKREYIKNLVWQLEKENPGFKTRLFTAMEGSKVGGFGDFPE